ncbi:MAG: replication/repair protein RecF [Caulobacteraceae bacterium]|nr:replication/repair protein RecF [Caulobacteraceae bacterium]
MSALVSLTLTNFRSYEQGALEPGGRSVVLHGPNGAGKTNLLEAISLFSPGKGLRGAAVSELGRRVPSEVEGRAWAVSAVIGETQLGTGIETPGAARRTVRIEGETVPPGRMADLLRPVWLTPAQDRLFLEAAGERRKFFDRLVFAAEPGHAVHASIYEKAMRERMRLLTDEGTPPDQSWLSALEAQLAKAGAQLSLARARTLVVLQAEIDSRGARPFPQARLSLAGDWETMAATGAGEAEIEARLAAALAQARPRDAAARRAMTGPHRGDLAVIHGPKDRPAAECSTGEQKALILNLVLAQAARLSRAESSPSPILLLDEVAAHLDAKRREALAEELAALDLQAFLTGTDEALFLPFKGLALSVAVSEAGLVRLDD